MRTLIDRAGKEFRAPPGVVLVVGGGRGDSLEALRALGAKRLVLAEADPRLSATLARRIDPAKGEELVDKALVARAEGDAILYVVDQAEYSSTLAPRGLFKLFPNLNLVEERPVGTLEFPVLVSSLALEESQPHLLIIDAPGQGLALLASLPGALLRKFSEILVRASDVSLYADDATTDEVATFLGNAGFTTPELDAEAIYPVQALRSRRDAARCELIRVIDDGRAELEQREAEIARLKAQVDEQADALAQATRGHEAEVGKLAKERDVLLEQLKQERDAQAQLAKAHEVELNKLAEARGVLLEQLTQERDAQVQLAKAREGELNKLAEEHGALVEQLAQARDEGARLADEKEALAGQLIEARDVQAKVAKEHDAQMQERHLEIQAQAKGLAEKDARLAELTKELEQSRRDVAERQAKLDKASHQGQERGARIIELERDREELDRYQAWLNREVVKAEAHVELIKELVLRSEQS
ncbi:hypothetical protein [Marilutibacter aestuarii]|uniref:Uncharacterized protein n=1 Tax=Marilutibacter aestuarii TaxID=1706195 RepID=A0A508AMI7_9GAMM|nr:hypothetical protein [Lysobacter aestuarii]TQD51009.1 hypothetical protein FKV25_02705 [Lysobacter aestuarii]